MSEHNDALKILSQHASLQEKLISTHKTMQSLFPFIARIAITLYDPATTLLKTYIHSSGEDTPLDHYQTPLGKVPSLKALLEKGLPRIINNMVTTEDSTNEHTKRIARQGYAASYTLPMFDNGYFIGFLFFNSYERDVFTEECLANIDIYAHIISLMVVNELNTVNTLNAAIKTTSSITHVRDPETGSHLDRMSRYSRLIANELAEQYNLDDDYIEHIFMFAPLHDIGKIGIPDNILLKPGPLTNKEMAIMRTHAQQGRNIIDDLLKNFGLEHIQHLDILRNIIEFHHEAIDGTGYPKGLKGDAIPVESRIVAVADIFDALTSKRTYKEAWTNQAAIALLEELANTTLDPHCVNALIDNIDEIEIIQSLFKEEQI